MPGGIVYRGPKQDREPSGLTAQEILEAIKAAKPQFGVARIGNVYVAVRRCSITGETIALGSGRNTFGEAQADADRERSKAERQE